MTNSNTYSHKGFKYGIIGLLLFINLIIYSRLLNLLTWEGFDTTSRDLIISILFIGTGIVGGIGFYQTIKGFKEPNTFKKIIGLIINVVITGLFIASIISIIFKIYQDFYS